MNNTCERRVDEEERDDDDEDNSDGGDGSEGDDDGEDNEIRETRPAELDQITSEEEDQERREEDSEGRNSFIGVSARWIARRLRKAIIGCENNHYCKRVGLTRSICSRVNTDGKFYHLYTIY